MSTRIRRLRNPLLDTLCHLEGNAKPCLLLEPLWGIPYNLYLPFVSVYMAALGLSATEIGLVSTVFFASQMVWALLSGPLTDKLGRPGMHRDFRLPQLVGARAAVDVRAELLVVPGGGGVQRRLAGDGEFLESAHGRGRAPGKAGALFFHCPCGGADCRLCGAHPVSVCAAVHGGAHHAGALWHSPL